jgi:glycosyltransferase involved in cell wall biosynthesis
MILPTYLPETFGGAEWQARRLSQALARMGTAVTILAPRLHQQTPARETEGIVAVRRFRLVSAPNLGGRHFGSFLLWCGCIAGWLWRNRKSYDVVHVVHGRLHAFPAVLVGKWLKKPVVVKIGRGGEEHFDLLVVRRKRLFGPFFACRIAQDSSAWIANSREIFVDLLRFNIAAEKIDDIPNGVAVRPLTNKPPADGVTRFLCIGRLDPEKAVDQMIRVFAALPTTWPVELHILGDGQCRARLEALSQELALQGRAIFHGAVDDVVPWLARADFYVSTSLSEGMSNALLEAMSFGVPAIVSRVSGVADLVEDGVSGLLFARGDDAELKARLREALMMTPQVRRAMGEAAWESIHSRFSLERVAERHLALYQNLLEARS